MSYYIVASSRDWHWDGFQQFVANAPGMWQYVDSNEKLMDAVAASSPRYIFFLHWSSLVPDEIFENHECVCFHMTDVPYGRGGSPLQNLIVADKTETMMTALRMQREFDAGPVYAKLPMSLDGRAEEIYLRAGELCWQMIRMIITKAPTPTPQQGEPTLFRRRKPEQSLLPPEGTLLELYDHIRMLDAPSYPLAFIRYGEFQLQFRYAELKEDELHAQLIIRKT
jgi:methionyl-tRNA formyltransferase